MVLRIDRNRNTGLVHIAYMYNKAKWCHVAKVRLKRLVKKMRVKIVYLSSFCINQNNVRIHTVSNVKFQNITDEIQKNPMF